jgi:hypothetical protein
MIEVRDALPEHAVAMAPMLRLGDRAEAAALGFTPLAALMHALAASVVAHTVFVGDEPAAMFGLCCESILGNRGYVWMLGTCHVPANKRAVVVLSKKFIAEARTVYPVLECLVDMRYSATLGWVRWLGFRHVNTKSINGHNFAVYEMGA